MKAPLLAVDHLFVSYREKEVLRKICFHLHQGEILAIVGESGSGKSTILKAVAGLLGRGGKITEGSIRLRGEDIAHIAQGRRRELAGTAMAMIFQNAGASFCPVRKIGDQIYEAFRAHSPGGCGKALGPKEFRERARRICECIHLPEDALDEYPFRLSGGMGQRAGILAAMILEPDILLADEPTSALDTVTQASVAKELMGLRKRNGVSIVLVTHHMGVAWHMADSVLVMRHGEPVEMGTKEQIFSHPKELYTKELIRAVPRFAGGIA